MLSVHLLFRAWSKVKSRAGLETSASSYPALVHNQHIRDTLQGLLPWIIYHANQMGFDQNIRLIA
jgi:hypothetical protein